MRQSKSLLFVGLLSLAGGCATQSTTTPPKRSAAEEFPDEAAAGGGQRTPTPVVEDLKPRVDVSKQTADDYAKAYDESSKLLATGTDAATCKRAANIWDNFADRYPKVQSARFNQGLVYQRCGMTSDADQVYQGILRDNPQNADALAGLGVIAWRAGRAQEAESKFRQALAIDQRCLAANVNLAILLRARALRGNDLNAVREAQDNVRRALAVDGSNMSAYTTLALIYYDLAGTDRSKLEMASTVVDQGKRINEKYAPLWNASGLIWLRKKNVTMALREFRKAIEIDPNLMEAHMNIGAVTLSFRDYVSAERSFRAVLGKETKNVEAMLGLGVALRGQRKIKEAEAEYQAIAKLDSTVCAVPYNLGLLYQDYMSSSEEELKRAQIYFKEYVGRCGGSGKREVAAEAERRIKNIDETFRALAEAKALEADAARKAPPESKPAPVEEAPAEPKQEAAPKK